MEPSTYWLVATAAFLSSVFFSIAEGALLGYSRTKLEASLRGKASKERYHVYLDAEDRLLFTSHALQIVSRVLLIVAITMIALERNVLEASAAEGASGVIEARVDGATLAWTWLEAVGASLVLAGALGATGPRAWGHWKAEAVMLWGLPTLALVDWLVRPLTAILRFLNAVVARLSGVEQTVDEAEEIVDDIRSAALEGQAEGLIEEQHKDMIERVIQFKDVEVQEVMTPRTDMDAVDVEVGIDGAVAFAMEHGHSRIPVYEGTVDKVIGICYAKDLMQALSNLRPRLPESDAADDAADDAASASEPAPEPPTIRDLLRKPLFIPETKSVSALLQEFRAGRAHMAIVLDEYGGTAGLVTIEDILEELVGEIEDEYDEAEESAAMKRISDNLAHVDARLRIDEINEALDISLPEDGDYETLGGFLFSSFGKVPTIGEAISHENIEFTVLDADERKINRVKIHVDVNGA